jgi:hypothetical protein
MIEIQEWVGSNSRQFRVAGVPNRRISELGIFSFIFSVSDTAVRFSEFLLYQSVRYVITAKDFRVHLRVP